MSDTPQYPNEKPVPDREGLWWNLNDSADHPWGVSWHGAPWTEPYLAWYPYNCWVPCREGRWLECPSTSEFEIQLKEIKAAVFNPLTKLTEDELGTVAGCLMNVALDKPEKRELHTLALKIVEHLRLVRDAQPKENELPFD